MLTRVMQLTNSLLNGRRHLMNHMAITWWARETTYKENLEWETIITKLKGYWKDYLFFLLLLDTLVKRYMVATHRRTGHGELQPPRFFQIAIFGQKRKSHSGKPLDFWASNGENIWARDFSTPPSNSSRMPMPPQLDGDSD